MPVLWLRFVEMKIAFSTEVNRFTTLKGAKEIILVLKTTEQYFCFCFYIILARFHVIVQYYNNIIIPYHTIPNSVPSHPLTKCVWGETIMKMNYLQVVYTEHEEGPRSISSVTLTSFSTSFPPPSSGLFKNGSYIFELRSVSTAFGWLRQYNL